MSSRPRTGSALRRVAHRRRLGPAQRACPARARRFRYDLKRLLEYDLKRLLEELDGAGELERQYTSTLEERGELISEYDGAETRYRQYDALGTTDALLDEDDLAKILPYRL